VLIGTDAQGLAGIIDWGDATWGDPLGDFVGLWAWGGDRATQTAFAAAAMAMTATKWARLRYWGACYAIGTTYYGYKAGHASIHQIGLSWLQRMFDHKQLEDPFTPDG
jgi:aminoglycoside phosphotransferase (APT) family kinase protein